MNPAEIQLQCPGDFKNKHYLPFWHICSTCSSSLRLPRCYRCAYEYLKDGKLLSLIEFDLGMNIGIDVKMIIILYIGNGIYWTPNKISKKYKRKIRLDYVDYDFFGCSYDSDFSLDAMDNDHQNYKHRPKYISNLDEWSGNDAIDANDPYSSDGSYDPAEPDRDALDEWEKDFEQYNQMYETVKNRLENYNEEHHRTMCEKIKLPSNGEYIIDFDLDDNKIWKEVWDTIKRKDVILKLRNVRYMKK